MISIAVIDTFLLARKFMPRYAVDDTEETSAFWKFARDLIDCPIDARSAT